MTGAEAAEVAAAESALLEVRADRLEWSAGRFSAEGNVQIRFGGDSILAARASGTAEHVELETATWFHGGATIRFERGTIRVGNRDGAVEGVRLEPCACADGKPPMLSFRAARVAPIDAEVAVIRGGAIELFRVPLVPIPYWPVLLDPRRFRLLLPELGYGEPGLSARWHGRAGLGDYWFEGGPAFRQDRGLRGELEVDGPIEAQGELAYDWLDGGVRGAVATEGGFAGDWTGRPDRADAAGLGDRLAWEATVLGDTAYAEDYALAYVDRGVAYRESRAVAQARALRVDAWVPDDGSYGTLAAARFRPEWSRGGEAVAPWVQGGVQGTLDNPGPLGAAGIDARASHTWGAVHAEAVATGSARWTGGAVEGDAIAMARAEVPMWAEIGEKRFLFWPGAVARVDSFWPSYAVGPALRAQAVAGTTVAGIAVATPLDNTGELEPELSVDLAGERLSLRGDVSLDQQSVDLRATSDLGGGLGFLHAGDVWLGWGEVSLKTGRLVAGAGLTLDLAAEDTDPWALVPVAVEGASLRLGYDDGCSAILLSSALSPDRALPDVGVQLLLRR